MPTTNMPDREQENLDKDSEDPKKKVGYVQEIDGELVLVNDYGADPGAYGRADVVTVISHPDYHLVFVFRPNEVERGDVKILHAGEGNIERIQIKKSSKGAIVFRLVAIPADVSGDPREWDDFREVNGVRPIDLDPRAPEPPPTIKIPPE